MQGCEMFEDYETSELLDILNYILRSGRWKELEYVYSELVLELRKRSELMGMIY